MRTFLAALTAALLAGVAAAQPPVKSDAPTIGNTVGPSPLQRGLKAGSVKSDAPLLKSLTAEQRAEHAKKFPRGLKGRTPPAKMQAIPRFQAPVAAPTQSAFVPAKKFMWGNDQYGDCVPVASICSLAAWTTFCGQPVIATNAEAIAFARQHGWLNGTWATDVMDVMQREGVTIGGKVYKEGPYSAVDYNNNAALQAASAVGPLMVAIDADALPSSAGNRDGWYVTGNTNDQNTDHEVPILGFGPAKWLYEQINTPLPAALGPDQQGFLVFTWSTIGFVDHPWVKGTVVECFVRNPTTVGFTPTPQPTEKPFALIGANPQTTTAANPWAGIVWSTANAVSVTLDGKPVPASGTMPVAPAATTVYTLVATGPGGSATSAVTVYVGTTPTPGPTPTFEVVIGGQQFGFDPNTKQALLPAGWSGYNPNGGTVDAAALIGKVKICPEVKAALIGLAFAYLMNNPAAIEAAIAQFIAALASCQTQAPQPAMSAAPQRHGADVIYADRQTARYNQLPLVNGDTYRVQQDFYTPDGRALARIGGMYDYPQSPMASQAVMAADCQQFGASSTAATAGECGGATAPAPASQPLLYRVTHPFSRFRR